MHSRVMGSLQSTIKGLQVYKDIHGDTVVPQPFVVPQDDAKWPKELSGFKLGRQIARAREYYRRDLLPVEKLDALNQAGMVWDVSNANFESIVQAFRVFKDIYGHLRVPCGVNDDFIVPSQDPWPVDTWKMSLSQRTRQFRRRRGALSQEQMIQLNEIGFIFNVFDFEWNDNIIPSLQQYKDIYGNLEVPAPFQIPKCPPWPKSMHGRKLGELLHRLRRTRGSLSLVQLEQLNQLGIVWKPNAHRFNTRILPALRHFHQLQGHLRISQAFKVPEQSTYPLETWGLALGSSLSGMRLKVTYYQQVQDHLEELEAMGFSFSTLPKKQLNVEELIQGLKIYQQIHGHMLVPASFKPETDVNWPQEFKDLPLGKLVERARYLNKTDQLDSEVKEYLTSEGMIWVAKKFKYKILPAIQRYFELYLNFDIPHKFRVPSTAEWPRACWDEPLGLQVLKIRHGQMNLEPEDREMLLDMGFTFEKRMSKRWRERVFPAMVKYVELHGTADVPMEYRIPNTSEWDPSLHGFWLGKSVYKTERGLHYRDMPDADRQKLLQLGFKL